MGLSIVSKVFLHSIIRDDAYRRRFDSVSMSQRLIQSLEMNLLFKSRHYYLPHHALFFLNILLNLLFLRNQSLDLAIHSRTHIAPIISTTAPGYSPNPDSCFLVKIWLLHLYSMMNRKRSRHVSSTSKASWRYSRKSNAVLNVLHPKIMHLPHIRNPKTSRETFYCRTNTFRHWMDIKESGVCILFGLCGRPNHRKMTCNTMSLPSNLANFMFNVDSPSPDIPNIRLSSFKWHKEKKKWTCQHPAWLVITMIRKMCGIMVSCGKCPDFIELEGTKVQFGEKEYWFTSLGILVEVMKAFRQECPDQYLTVFIEHMPYNYLWNKDLAMFLHVLAQMTRLPAYMPCGLKVIFSGNYKCLNKLWVQYNGMVAEEVKAGKTSGILLQPEEAPSQAGEIVHLYWCDRRTKDEKQREAKLLLPRKNDDQEVLLLPWSEGKQLLITWPDKGETPKPEIESDDE